MTDNITKGETHGCIVCGKLYQIYAVYDKDGKYLDSKLLSTGAIIVPNTNRPLVACEKHSEVDVERAIEKVYGEKTFKEN